jgi:hypothetical protein
VLCVDGYEFICDPGTFIYTALPDQRNLFRSTAFHSTLVVGGREQHRIPSDMREGLFWVQSNNANASTLTCTHTEWVACHKGYGKIHTRRVAIDNSTIIVQDDCTLDLPKSIICMLHPTVEVHRVEKGVECTRDGRTLRIQSDDAISVENAWYSPEYGMRVPTTRLVMMMSSHRHEFRITRIEASTTSAS